MLDWLGISKSRRPLEGRALSVKEKRERSKDWSRVTGKSINGSSEHRHYHSEEL